MFPASVRHLLRIPAFTTVWLVGFSQEMGFFLLVNLPGRLQQLGLSEGGIGLAYSASALTALVLRPYFGRILDAVHRRTVLRTVGLANIGLIAALATIDATGAVLWTAFLAQRVAQIMLFTTLLTYGADTLPPEHRTEGLAVLGLSGLIPIGTANLLGDGLIGLFGYAGVLWAAALACTGSWLLAWRLPLLPVLGRRPRRGFWTAAVQRDMLPLWWITLMFALGMETVFTFMRTYVTARGVGGLALFFGIYGGAAALARLGGGGRYDSLPHRGMIVGAILTQGAGLMLVGVARGIPALGAGALLLGTAHGVIFPILSSQVVGRARTAERGSAVATFTSIIDIGLLLVAPSVGFLIEGRGYGYAFAAVGAVLMGGALVYRLWERPSVPLPAPVATER